MTRTLILASIVVATVGSAALPQSTPEKTGVNSVVEGAPKTEDFVLEAASSDLFEIQFSTLAIERSDEKTKAFAQMMLADHQKTSDELKAMVASGKVKATIPSSMSSAHQGMLDDLKKLQGDDFTKQYHSDQEEVYEDAVDLFKRYGDEGENAELRAWAGKTRSALAPSSNGDGHEQISQYRLSSSVVRGGQVFEDPMLFGSQASYDRSEEAVRRRFHQAIPFRPGRGA
jgi:putative membrane protein